MSNERGKNHIDKIRDSAMSMQVGDESDGPMFGMVSVADTDLYIVRKHAIYRVFLADEIDPERTNSSIPNGQQRLVGQGAASEIVSRSFLTADVLFNSNQFDGEVDLKQVIDLSILVMKELLAAQKIEHELIEEQGAELTAFKQPEQRSVALPSVEGLNERLKTFVQKIEHAAQAIYRFTQLFYDHKQKMWNGFEAEIQKLYGDTDELSKFASGIRPFMIFVRNLRHSIEHPKASQRLIVKDFSIPPTGTLMSPTVELVHTETPQPEMDLQPFLSQVAGQILEIFEGLMVLFASKQIKPFGGFEKAVGLLPADQLPPDSKVRVSYLIWINGGWNKLG